MRSDNRIYVFSGKSGAGKDTCAKLIPKSMNIKFSAPGKRALEAIMELPAGFLDDRVKRQQVAPWCQGRTYLQVLMDFSLHRDKVIGKDFFPRKVMSQIEDTILEGYDVCITDIRHYSEGYLIADMNQMGYEVVPCWVIGGEQLATDKDSFNILMDLCRRCDLTQPLFIDNRWKDMYALKSRLKEIYEHGVKSPCQS